MPDKQKTILVGDVTFGIPDFGTWNFLQDTNLIAILAKLPIVGGLISGRIELADVILSMQSLDMLDDVLFTLFVPVGERYTMKRAEELKSLYGAQIKEAITNDIFEEALTCFFASAKASKLAGFLSRLQSKTAATKT